MGRRYFLAGGVLEAAGFFACAELLAFACFCEDFFWFAFGDLSPMVVVVVLVLIAAEAPSGSPQRMDYSSACRPCQAAVVIRPDGLRLTGQCGHSEKFIALDRISIDPAKLNGQPCLRPIQTSSSRCSYPVMRHRVLPADGTDPVLLARAALARTAVV